MRQPTRPTQGARAACWLGAVPASEVRARFGLRLKGFRQSAGFKTARAFAEALELDENRYTRYERGEVEPNLANICRMCSVLGVEPNELLGFSEAPSEPITSAGEAAQAGRTGEDKPGPSQAAPLRPAKMTR
jgi:transcriptional regulator with XRE-family HTH domain